MEFYYLHIYIYIYSHTSYVCVLGMPAGGFSTIRGDMTKRVDKWGMRIRKGLEKELKKKEEKKKSGKDKGGKGVRGLFWGKG